MATIHELWRDTRLAVENTVTTYSITRVSNNAFVDCLIQQILAEYLFHLLSFWKASTLHTLAHASH